MSKISVAVVGASGYTGLELIKMLLVHPNFEIACLANSQGGTTLAELHPALAGLGEMEVIAADPDAVAAKAKLAFLALPHKTAMAVAKELLARGMKVVDLSADYRLERETYEAWYCPHEDPENLPRAVYGMPELFREELKKADLIAGPGCHATASILAMLPFLPYLDETAPIFLDSKTGVSGGGKKCTDTFHFCSIDENMHAYNPFGHRHTPEIREKLKIASGKEWEVLFVPQLVPLVRGMLVSGYASLKEKVDPVMVMEEYYRDEPFIRVRKEPVQTKNVAGTNFCDLYAKTEGNRLFVSSAIDNLMKGASSVSLSCANLMMGLPESAGIPVIANIP